ncbi:hypothetical protein M2347_000169 [Chryseobacterium sp. H1D6B]|uniref:glycosyltransferase family 39 protein n=1 Tax=Chryseobacterium sp. H1D6B TaxID=2940588 RepID=UPI0015C6E5ED|nr:glycosyltransferase family 39 protein [Chryseobacterium sp. H1D6B]MDH6250442.1 hypothetical protein [Chryseobacterium sp. H1D6B]
MNSSNNKYQIYTFLYLLFLAVTYALSTGKDPALGDSLGFTIQGYNGFEFQSNATNHFLYSNFLALLHTILPFINVHFLFVGVSILSAVIALYYLQKLLHLNGVSKKSSLICIMILGLSFTFWRQSIITEVYTFYLLFVILFLINLFKYLQEKDPKYFYYLSFFFGILFLIHIQTILFIPLYLYLLVKNFRFLKKNLIYGVLITVLLFSILLIPVLMGRHTFTSIFTSDIYANFIFDFDITVIFKSIIKALGYLIYNFIFFAAFLFWGLKSKKHIDYIIIGVLPFLAFCIKYNIPDIYVFHLVPYVFFLIFIGRGLDRFPKIYLLLPLILPFVYFAAFKIAAHTETGKDIDMEKGYKGGIRYVLFPPLHNNPDLSDFIIKYKEDSLYKRPELKAMYPLVIEWENIKKK